MRRAHKAYYNENDPKTAAWLRELIKAGLVADGEVDERSIVDVQPGDLRGFVQCHFFAGIGGWSYALRLAGWPDDRPVWTGSCPCQPFSAAGKGDGAADPRHLWPAWFRLITECRPATLFGEQVASINGLAWFDAVSTDLEASDYAVASADLCAAGVGAPHIRQRLWFVADARHRTGRASVERFDRSEEEHRQEDNGTAISGGDVGISPGSRRERRLRDQSTHGQSVQAGLWTSCEWIPCRDGKARPVEPGTFPLAHGLPARVGRLRGYGNAIVPQVAAAFIQAAAESLSDA